MKIIGIIPARYASSRFPGKPLVDICGKSMLQRVYEQSAKAIKEVWVATDDQRIFDEVKRFGGQVIMTGESHESGTERCAEVALKLDNIGEEDVIINIQGDEPIINPEQIQLLSDLFKDRKIKIGTLVKPIEDHRIYLDPNNPKVVLDNNLRAIYFSRSPIPYNRTKPNNIHNMPVYQHIGIYAYRVSSLLEISKLPSSPLEENEKLEQLRWIENGYSIHAGITKHATHSIDSPEDLENLIRNFSKFLT